MYNNNETHLRLITWNVRGLFLHGHRLHLLAPQHADIIVCQETWTPVSEVSPELEGYVRYDSPRTLPNPPRPTNRARGGGVCIYVRQALSHYTKEWKRTHCGDVLWLRVDLPGLARPLYIAGCYILPFNSPAAPGYPDGPERWERLRADVQLAHTLGMVLMGGDFNARLPPGLEDRSFNEVGPLPRALELQPPDTSWAPRRETQETKPNPFGPQLANLCRDHHLLILNGRCHGDRDGRFTRIQGPQKSVLDYWICTADLYGSIKQLSVEALHKGQSHSDHRPVLVDIVLPCQVETPTPHGPPRPRHHADHDPVFGSLLLAALDQAGFNASVLDSTLPTEVLGGTFLDCVVESVRRAYARPSPRTPTSDSNSTPRPRPRRRLPWFDDECRALKTQRNKLLRACSTAEERAEVFRWHRAMMGFKAWRYHREKINSMVKELRSNPRRLAQRLRPKDQTPCPCTPEDLRLHFETLFAPTAPPVKGKIRQSHVHEFRHLIRDPEPELAPEPRSPSTPTTEQTPQGPFSARVVARAAARLRNHAAYDEHGLCAEFIKAICHHQVDPELQESVEASEPRPLLHLLTQLLNRFYHDGFPALFASAQVVPIHKKGDRTVPSNYRGIAIISIIAKLYASLLEKRLSTMLEVSRARGLTQAGFRPQRSTTDQIFVLQQLIDQECRFYRQKRAHPRAPPAPRGAYGRPKITRPPPPPQQLYCCFVDFSKAFDSVPASLESSC